MKSQIFKEHISNNILFDLLDKISVKNDKYYILNKVSYKKGEYINVLAPFFQILLPSYHISKTFYINRKQNYSSFITIIRQICRLNNINYSSKIIYNKSSYDIIYYIYFTGIVLDNNHIDTSNNSIL